MGPPGPLSPAWDGDSNDMTRWVVLVLALALALAVRIRQHW